MILSKSKYLKYSQCPKILWLEKNKSEIVEKKEFKLPIYNPNKIIDDFSKSLFEGKDATILKDSKLDYRQMEIETQKLLNKGISVIYKATFCLEGTYFVFDILRKCKSGYMLYMVKNSKNLKQLFINEMAYYSFICSRLNLKIYRYIVITVNSKFVKQGEIDPKKFFKMNFVGTKINEIKKDLFESIQNLDNILNQDQEPNICYGAQCNSPHPCEFIKYCQKPLPSPSVFDLYAFNKKLEMYNQNILSFRDLLDNNIKLNDFQKRQIDFELNNLPTFVDKEKLKEYLKNFTYPLYFLDFETTMEDIPLYDGNSPFELVPFQYSLHYILKEGGEVYHTEYLAQIYKDPRIDLVEKLIKDIPLNSTIVAYNANFEKTVIRKLASKFKNHEDYLLKLTENFVDLIDPFEKGYVYDKLMGGSFSLKSVLPSLYPNDPSLNYNNLEDVHNGQDARMIFPALKFMDEKQREKERENLLKYCYLDTYAMVKILEKLKEFVS